MATTYDPTTADVGVVQKIPADKLVIDPNVRRDIRLDKSFVSSVRVYGFLQPAVGYLDADGLAHVTIGQRRVSAALEIGWPVIPILIKPRVDAEHDRSEELRVLAQLAENEQRATLTPTELAGGYKQLALLGVTEDQIARKTNAPKGRVQTALKVIASKVASAEMAEHELTLDQAAVLVEFEDDKKALEAVQHTALTAPHQLEHVAQQQRSRIARERHGQSLADKHRAEGWEVIVRKDNDGHGYGLPKGLLDIDSLCRVDDKSRKALTLEDVQDHPARAIVINPRFANRTDQAETWICVRDASKHGFKDRWSTGPVKGGLSEKEKAERRQKRVDKSEMVAATVVRRAWIRDVLLQRKPDTVAHTPWMVQVFFELPDGLRYDQARDHDAAELACELLGLELVKRKYDLYDTEATILQAIHETGPVEQQRLLLALAISRVEYPAGNPKHHAFGQHEELAPYFLQLQEWGYGLADVEQRIVDAATKANAKAAAKRAAR